MSSIFEQSKTDIWGTANAKPAKVAKVDGTATCCMRRRSGYKILWILLLTIEGYRRILLDVAVREKAVMQGT